MGSKAKILKVKKQAAVTSEFPSMSESDVEMQPSQSDGGAAASDAKMIDTNAG